MPRLHRLLHLLFRATALVALLLIAWPGRLNAQTGAPQDVPRLVVFEAFMRST